MCRAVFESEEYAQERSRSALHDSLNICVEIIFFLFSAF